MNEKEEEKNTCKKKNRNRKHFFSSKKKSTKKAMLLFFACLLVVSLYVLPYYLLSHESLRGHRDDPRTIRARAACSLGSCVAISLLLVVAARLRFDDGEDGNDGNGENESRRQHLVEARLALSDPLVWLRASFPAWAVRSLVPALAEAVANALGAGKGAARAWRRAAAEEAARLQTSSLSSSSSSSFVPSPAAATLRLLGLSPLSAVGPGALVGTVSICCLLAWPLAQRAVELFEGGGEKGRGGEEKKKRWWSLRRRRQRRESNGGSSAPFFSFSSFFPGFPQATTLRDLVIAPLTEELAFRGCLLPTLLLLSGKQATALAASSAAFAAAHLHHAAATLLSPTLPPKQRRAVLWNALLQLLYTFAFGAAAGALLLASGSLAAPVAAHSLANFLGLPRARKNNPSASSSSPSSSLLLRRIEAAVGALGVAAFALMAAGCGFFGRGNRKSSSKSSFVPFSGLAGKLGAAGHGARYRALAAALSPPPPV